MRRAPPLAGPSGQDHRWTSPCLLAVARTATQIPACLIRPRTWFPSPSRRGQHDRHARHWPCNGSLTGHTGTVNSVAFSPDGTTLASGSADTTVRLWDVASGQEAQILTGHDAPVLAVGFDADGKALISAGEDGTVKVWDAATGGELHAGRSGRPICDEAPSRARRHG